MVCMCTPFGSNRIGKGRFPDSFRRIARFSRVDGVIPLPPLGRGDLRLLFVSEGVDSPDWAFFSVGLSVFLSVVVSMLLNGIGSRMELIGKIDWSVRSSSSRAVQWISSSLRVVRSSFAGVCRLGTSPALLCRGARSRSSCTSIRLPCPS